jgi:hypothetical protein
MFQLDRARPPHPGPGASITTTFDRRGQPVGWRLKPFVTMRGARGRTWRSAAEAIAATKLMRLA